MRWSSSGATLPTVVIFDRLDRRDEAGAASVPKDAILPTTDAPRDQSETLGDDLRFGDQASGDLGRRFEHRSCLFEG